MIANERQRRYTRRKLADLNELVEATKAGRAGDDAFRDLQLKALESKVDDLVSELMAYETIPFDKLSWGVLG